MTVGLINATLTERRYRRISASHSRIIVAKINPKELFMNTLSISRRKFAQLLGAGAAAAIVRPRITVATERPATKTASTGSVVRLSANENPYGPSPKAHKAMNDSFGVCCRYPDEANDVLIEK